MLVTVLRFPDTLATQLAIISDVFGAVNRIIASRSYRVEVIEADDAGNVSALAEAELRGRAALNSADILVVCGAAALPGQQTAKPLTWLKVAAARSRMVGAVGRGVVVLALAQAGLLADKKAAIPFELIPFIREHHADIEVRSSLFCFDGKLFTCAGGLAVFDALGHLLLTIEKPRIVNDVMRKFQAERLREEGDEQVFVGRGLPALKSPLLRNAIDMLMSSIDAPRAAVRLTAAMLGVSQRQLERVFCFGLGIGPAEFLRLERLKRAPPTVEFLDESDGYQPGRPAKARAAASSSSIAPDMAAAHETRPPSGPAARGPRRLCAARRQCQSGVPSSAPGAYSPHPDRT